MTDKHKKPKLRLVGPEIYEPLQNLPVDNGVTCTQDSYGHQCEVTVNEGGKKIVISQTITPIAERYIRATEILPNDLHDWMDRNHKLFTHNSEYQDAPPFFYTMMGTGANVQTVNDATLGTAETQAVNRLFHLKDNEAVKAGAKELADIAETAYGFTHPDPDPAKKRALTPEEENQLVLRMNKIAKGDKARSQ